MSPPTRGRNTRGLPASGRIVLVADDVLVGELDRFMDENPDIPSRSAAIRVLVMQALGTPQIRTVANESFHALGAIERQFFRRVFAVAREKHVEIIAEVMTEEGWDAGFVAEVVRETDAERSPKQRRPPTRRKA